MSPDRGGSAVTAAGAAAATDVAAEHRDRKAEHIELSLEQGMQLRASFFDEYVFDHQALPEIDYDDIDLETEFLGRALEAPLLISCMTGGTGEATRINRNLAEAAQRAGIAVGVGSQRKALEDPVQAESFKIRPLAPSVPLLANLGAVQLNYGFGIDQCRAAVEMIDADALVFHLNPLQEAIQPEGQCDFSGLVEKMGAIGRELDVPLVVKEIGCGLSVEAAKGIREAGISIVDSAGLGGTSWARIEASRASDVELGELFADWGVSTPRSIQALRSVGGLTIIGSGGVRRGLDAAKAIAMGADMVGLAQPFLVAAVDSADRVVEAARRVERELRIAMFCLGVRSIAELQRVELLKRTER
ncbi:MAG: type 2 isopentenyl-diphosphate Delta-isomerase [Acidobacteriota bacterium]|nr:type 2 isopentenyl-diphosphate Delta-isomerase [Acidobacteriota bacterium]